jgi:poly-gamma-glutamate synthesis protein (capsule biosynthesis protein)
MVLAFTGDTFINRRMSVRTDAGFLAVKGILDRGDAALTVSESLFHDFEAAPIPDAVGYGTYAHCDPAVIADLKWFGIDMVSTANHHCYGYGEQGVLTNLANLDAFGMPHAGTGRTLTEAAAPAYLETEKGTVALLGVTLSLPNLEHRAGDPRGPIPGRPGANVVRKKTTNVVPQETFDTLRDAVQRLGLAGRGIFAPTDTELTLAGQRFAVGDDFAQELVVNEHDLDLNLSWIRDARGMADYVVVAMYGMEGGQTIDDPSPLAQLFARAAIDAGADAVFGTGPHRDRGIEIYQGKPIMYSLSSLFYENEIIKWQPDDLFEKYGLGTDATPSQLYDLRTGGGTRLDPLGFRSVVVEAEFQDGALQRLLLHPIDCGYGQPRHRRGRPALAEGEVAEGILLRLQELSARLGTEIEIVDGVGVITVAAAEADRT